MGNGSSELGAKRGIPLGDKIWRASYRESTVGALFPSYGWFTALGSWVYGYLYERGYESIAYTSSCSTSAALRSVVGDPFWRMPYFGFYPGIALADAERA